MACKQPDCTKKKHEILKQFAIILRQAQELAYNTGENVYIFSGTNTPFDYMVESEAKANGKQPTGGIVTPMRPVTT